MKRIKLILVLFYVCQASSLTLSKPEYYDKSSPASKGKLSFQGDVMCDTVAAHFENNPDAQLVIRIRYWGTKLNYKKCLLKR